MTAPLPRTAVILAAGNGRRLHDDVQDPPSKPLTHVGGVPLIVRTLVRLREKGVLHAVVVTGYRADEVRETVRRDERVRGMDVVFAHNDEWRGSNGISVLAARPHVDGEFLLLMADHVFTPELLDRVLADEARPDAGGAVLGVDRKISDVYDLDDATLVRTDGRNRIVSISKDLTDYDAVDTGVFRCTPGLLDALEVTRAERGDCSLSDGIQRLAAAGLMRVRDVGDAWWQDVDTPGALAHAEHLLFESCRKPVDGWVARHLNRNISLAISRRLADTRIRPNHVTAFNFFVGVLAALAATVPSYGWLLLAAVLRQACSVIDGVDGELSRVRLQGTRLGQWLDTLTDDVTTLLYYAGLTWGLSRLAGAEWFVAAGGVTVALYALARALDYRELIARGSGDLYSLEWDFDAPSEQATQYTRVMHAVVRVTKQDFRILAFVGLALFGLLPYSLFFMAPGTVGNLAATVARTWRLRGTARRRVARRIAA